MATTKKPTINPIAELGVLLDGASLEKLADLLAEPDADLTPGELAKLGAAFSDVGKTLTEGAKALMHNKLAGVIGGKEIDAGVLFQYKAPTTQTRVDSARVRKELPPEEYPALYTTSAVKGGVSITL